MAEKSVTRSPWWYFAGGVVSTIVVVLLLAFFGILGGSCAVRQCTAANPCVLGGVTYVAGSICRAETSACGYIGRCRSSVGAAGVPECNCTINPF